MISILILMCFVGARAEDIATGLRVAVFSKRQLFWPKLDDATAKIKKADSIRIGILPIEFKDYHESVQCDSCHRLSANGMEFWLENYLADHMHGRFPNHPVDLIAPHFPLLETRKIDLLGYLDSTDFPWARWFDDSSQALIYRPKDRMTSDVTRKRMDRLGGLLGVTHLLLPSGAWVKADPVSSTTHFGGLAWGFRLVFWNVAQGRPEWSAIYSEKDLAMDLDAALDAHLDKGLGAALDKIPDCLDALWKAEPR